MATDPIRLLDVRVCGALDRMPRLRLVERDEYDELTALECELAGRAVRLAHWRRPRRPSSTDLAAA